MDFDNIKFYLLIFTYIYLYFIFACKHYCNCAYCAGFPLLVDLRKIISAGSSLTLCTLLIIAVMVAPAGTGNQILRYGGSRQNR